MIFFGLLSQQASSGIKPQDVRAKAAEAHNILLNAFKVRLAVVGSAALHVFVVSITKAVLYTDPRHKRDVILAPLGGACATTEVPVD